MKTANQVNFFTSDKLFEFALILYHAILLILVWFGNVSIRMLGLLLLFEIFFAGVCEIVIACKPKTKNGASSSPFFIIGSLFSFLFVMGIIFAIVNASLVERMNYSIGIFVSENALYLVFLFLPFSVRMFSAKPEENRVFSVFAKLLLFFLILVACSIIFYLLRNVLPIMSDPAAIMPRVFLTIALIAKILIEFAIYRRTEFPI